MKPVIEKHAQHTILYDNDISEQITQDWFELRFWTEKGSFSPVGLGRGTTWYVSIAGHDYVLRHYKRGGMMARISDDRYLWTGLEQTRAWREWRLLAHIYQAGLPGPRPLAARVTRHGLFYSADILTCKIADTESLSSYIKRTELGVTGWQSIGACIRRFHDAHIYHADLNAHNILLDINGNIFLIDFDKGRIDQGESWKQRNLQRLRRSLDKLSRQGGDCYFNEINWDSLLSGYLGKTND